MAADISELMKSRGITKACAMGHSMGGRTMMHLALKHVSTPFSLTEFYSPMQQLYIFKYFFSHSLN